MINNLLSEVNKIYIAYGITDFRKQISSLCNIVQNEFKMNPYDKSAYIFCNKPNSIKVLKSIAISRLFWYNVHIESEKKLWKNHMKNCNKI